MSGVLRSLKIVVGADIKAAQAEMKRIASELKKTGREMQRTGKTLTNSITKPVMIATGALAAATLHAGKYGDEISTMATQMGLTTDQIQQMSYAAKGLDIETEDLARGFARVTMSIGQVIGKGKSFIDVGGGLKVALRSTNGELRDTEDVFTDVIRQIGKLPNETARNVAAQKIFGRSFQTLNPLIAAGADRLAEYMDEAKRVGAVIDNDTIMALDSFNDTMAQMTMIVKAAFVQVGKAFLPVMQQIKPIITDVVVPAVKWLAQAISDTIKWFKEIDPISRGFITSLATMAFVAGPVIKGIGGIIVSLGSFAKAQAAVLAAEAAGGVVPTLTKIATLGPIAAGAVIGIVGAVALFSMAMREGAKNARITKQEIDGVAKAVRSANKAFSGSTTAAQSEYNIAKKLIAELDNLRGKSKRTTDEQARMADIVAQLNKLVPTLDVSINKQTGRISKSTVELNKNADAWIDNAKAQARAQFLVDQEKNRLETLNKIQQGYGGSLGDVSNLSQNDLQMRIRDVYGDILPTGLKDLMRTLYGAESTIKGISAEASKMPQFRSQQTQMPTMQKESRLAPIIVEVKPQANAKPTTAKIETTSNITINLDGREIANVVDRQTSSAKLQMGVR